ncbi:hypothetical protein PRVXH_002220 [Proteinivorax hydrogeniformans]|uniref:Uncharacterized protein n=1 Tax=Proteinivorax hydrogeniformans TaxID=1826727 RepID=A0AAU8HSX9_9FIRM
MDFNDLRNNCAIEQKKGIHFILASIIIWGLIAIIHLTDLPISTKNLYTFISTSLLVPLSYVISRVINVRFSNKENPFNNLGFVLTMNQMLYLLIAMWVYAAAPEKLVMVLAIIFGAHLLPFGWLYKSISYRMAAVIIPIVALIVGLIYEAYILAIIMIFIEVLFSISLALELKGNTATEKEEKAI